MIDHLRYARYVARHKWFVFQAGLRLGVPIHQLIVHDWTKLRPSEWRPYVAHFYGKSSPTTREGYYHQPDLAKVAFNTAWLRHCMDNKHHWQRYAMVSEPGAEPVVIPMPRRFIREMVADWSGAGKAQGVGPNPNPWYERNRDRMILHPETRRYVEQVLGELL